ncbi:MAG: endonuclease/exonuclease/phosphatase family protein [Nocardioides sp.]
MSAIVMALVAAVLASGPVDAATTAARQEGVPAASQAATRVKVVDHNIEKRSLALDRALKAAAVNDAAVITLQEVCWWQADQLVATHPEWTIAWKPERDRGKCRRSGIPGGTLVSPQERVGNVAIWTGGPGGVTTTHTFATQRVASDRAGLACVSWVDGARQHACSAHLIVPFSNREAAVRTKQARDVRKITGRWLAQDDLVIVGGDFNAVPKRKTMGYLYAYQGQGNFREATSRALGARDCRCRQPTMDKRRQKIDYIFYSTNRLGPRDFRGLRTVRTMSDHHLLIGWADVDTSAR